MFTMIVSLYEMRVMHVFKIVPHRTQYIVWFFFLPDKHLLRRNPMQSHVSLSLALSIEFVFMNIFVAIAIRFPLLRYTLLRFMFQAHGV